MFVDDAAAAALAAGPPLDLPRDVVAAGLVGLVAGLGLLTLLSVFPGKSLVLDEDDAVAADDDDDCTDDPTRTKVPNDDDDEKAPDDDETAPLVVNDAGLAAASRRAEKRFGLPRAAFEHAIRDATAARNAARAKEDDDDDLDDDLDDDEPSLMSALAPVAGVAVATAAYVLLDRSPDDVPAWARSAAHVAARLFPREASVFGFTAS
mmetsp:Transcript_26572/g.106397  ORF Transcript_26572/g.106397 Transcript_26572/m.106397 type:complete len:207 (-) Transcript_26572:231-851(-)